MRPNQTQDHHIAAIPFLVCAEARRHATHCHCKRVDSTGPTYWRRRSVSGDFIGTLCILLK